MTLNAAEQASEGRFPARSAAQLDARTRQLIEAPITATLLRLAAPNVLVMLAQASVGLIETYFVGKLGTAALAGVALVFRQRPLARGSTYLLERHLLERDPDLGV